MSPVPTPAKQAGENSIWVENKKNLKSLKHFFYLFFFGLDIVPIKTLYLTETGVGSFILQI